jgi:hypothetical protein
VEAAIAREHARRRAHPEHIAQAPGVNGGQEAGVRVNESERSVGSQPRELRVKDPGKLANIKKRVRVQGVEDTFYKRRSICRQQ